jgi:hypothetical protein
MDVEGTWKERQIFENYPSDAMWFIIHIEMYYLACCVPSEEGDDFVLTENSYSIHEGPTSTTTNAVT